MCLKMNHKEGLIIGIDVGLGVRSALGLAAIKNGKIIGAREVWATDKNLPQKLRSLGLELEVFLKSIGEDYETPFVDAIYFEYFVMRGKSGESLQRLVGALMSASPTDTPFIPVQNSTVKKLIGGKGNDDKKKVAEGVLRLLGKDPENKALIERLISNEKWDILDAIAIALAGEQMQEAIPKEDMKKSV